MTPTQTTLSLGSSVVDEYVRAAHNLNYGTARLVTISGEPGSGVGAVVSTVQQKLRREVRTVHVGTLVRDELQSVIDIIVNLPNASTDELLDHVLVGFACGDFPINPDAALALREVIDHLRVSKTTFRRGTGNQLRVPRLAGEELVVFKKWENDIRRKYNSTFWARRTLKACLPTLAMDRSVFIAGVNWIDDLTHLRDFGAISIRFHHTLPLESSVTGLPEHVSMKEPEAYDLVIDASRTSQTLARDAALAFLTR